MAHPSVNLVLAASLLGAGCYQGAAVDSASAGSSASTGPGGSADDGPGSDGGDGGDSGEGEAPPRPVVIEPLHRLNRLEYNNTVRDLLGTTLRPADSFPPDTVTDGFDNVADGLTLTPALMDLYATAARDLSSATLLPAPRWAAHIGAREHATATGQAGNAFDWGWSMSRFQEGLAFAIDAPQAENVVLSILAGGDAFGKPTPEMGVLLDGVEVGHWVVTSLPTAPIVYTVPLALAPGPHSVVITFPNGSDQPAENIYNTLVVGYLDITSDTLVTPAGRALVYLCEPGAAPVPEDCYRTIVTRFTERAWRRPLTQTEADSVFALWQQLSATEGPDAAVGLVVRATLMSAKFLYRPSFPGPGEAEGPDALVPLDDHVLASRLSYFLWSSMPDALLMSAAAAGELRTDEGLKAQVERMLADPRAVGLRQGFAAQWLSTRALAYHAPDPTVFPGFDEPLRAAMAAEAELFFGDFLLNGEPVGTMMNPEFGYLNDRLAQHYGLPLPNSGEMTRVPLADGQRGGIMMQGAWLTATSASDRTSPVVRGRWILEQVLCTPMPPPPPDIPPLMKPEQGETVRETLAKHRENPVCAGCHDLLDPAGLGMEKFDGIGALRVLENGQPIDVSGGIPPQIPFEGASELAALLEDDPRFTQCLTEKLFSYAIGRKKVPKDFPYLDEIDAALAETSGTLIDIIDLIALSPAFRMRPKQVE